MLSSGASYTNIQNLSVGPGYNIIVSENKNNENLEMSHHLDISVNKNIKFTKFRIDVGWISGVVCLDLLFISFYGRY